MSMGTEGTPMGSTDANSSFVTFDSTEEKELLVPTGEQTESVIVQANPENPDKTYLMFDEDSDKAEAITLTAGTIIGADINASANPLYVATDDVSNSVTVAWTK